MNNSRGHCRLAVDVGGTFTDVALELGAGVDTGAGAGASPASGGVVTAKVPTTPHAPEVGVIAAVGEVVREAGIEPGEIALLIHGTTLATNALIERTGAKTALLVTEGFRDSVEMALENRFEQYDISIDRPAPLVPRHLRWPVTERVNYRGEILVPLEEDSVHALVPQFERHGIEAAAVGLLHSYANPVHERQVGKILATALPELRITLSSEVCPEIREYERQSTACANAYVQPRMSGYLARMESELRALGLECPLLLMTSGGGLTTLHNATRFPIRLVESGPAGGAILATEVARECGSGNAVSFDMGGTTAKICLIDGWEPQTTRTFEVARAYRNLKGSGLPVRIPAIEMVEIGAGGGSIAKVDEMDRLGVGPASAGADPGPACYDRGGRQPTVTDADVVLGRIDPAGFAGGSVRLAPERAVESLRSAIGEPLGLTDPLAALSVSEMVDENMANAARVHAVEWGKDISARTMIAFGGAAPLHAARLAQKLGVGRVIVPTAAGVGSAIGMLRAAVSYEVVRSRYLRLAGFDPRAVNDLLAEMHEEARAVVAAGAGNDGEVEEARYAYMRYVGQGHEIVVPVPVRTLGAGDGEALAEAFDVEYARLYGRTIPGQEREVLSWTLTVTAGRPSSSPPPRPTPEDGATGPPPKARAARLRTGPPGTGDGTGPAGDDLGETKPPVRRLFDPVLADYAAAAVHRRERLAPDNTLTGPAVVVEEQTTTVVPDGFRATVDPLGYLVLERMDGRGEESTRDRGHEEERECAT